MAFRAQRRGVFLEGKVALEVEDCLVAERADLITVEGAKLSFLQRLLRRDLERGFKFLFTTLAAHEQSVHGLCCRPAFRRDLSQRRLSGWETLTGRPALRTRDSVDTGLVHGRFDGPARGLRPCAARCRRRAASTRMHPESAAP